MVRDSYVLQGEMLQLLENMGLCGNCMYES